MFLVRLSSISTCSYTLVPFTKVFLLHLRRLRTRLCRVEGHIRCVHGMFGSGASCEYIAQQLSAARRALDRSFYEMIACSMEMEMTQAADTSAVRAAGTKVGKLLARYG